VTWTVPAALSLAWRSLCSTLNMAVFAATTMGSRSWPLSYSLAIMSRADKVTKASRFMTPTRLYLYDTLLKRLAQDLKDMAAELGQFIQEEHAIVGQRHFSWHRHVASADQPRLRDGVVGTRHGRVVTHAVRSPVRSETR
jgi:hypothetical protein